MGLQRILREAFMSGQKTFANWVMAFYIALLTMIVIAISHAYEQKVMYQKQLIEEVKELKSEFVDVRSDLMRKKMESTIAENLEEKGIKPTETPAVKIELLEKKNKKWYQELW